MLKNSRFILALLLLCATIATQAKVGDCPAITQDNITYLSHDNYIEAFDNRTQAIQWHTEIFSEASSLFGGLLARLVGMEDDSGWNIACIKAIEGNHILATDSHKNTYRLDKITGKKISP